MARNQWRMDYASCHRKRRGGVGVGRLLLVFHRFLHILSETDASDRLGTDRFDPFRVGLDHLALAVANPESLHELKLQLDAAGVRNNGVEDDTLTGARYIAFYDPDGIAWELYAMPARR